MNWWAYEYLTAGEWGEEARRESKAEETEDEEREEEDEVGRAACYVYTKMQIPLCLDLGPWTMSHRGQPFVQLASD